MKYLLSNLALAAVAAAHGYVNNASIGGQEYVFYQPYQDPYTSPTPERISRPIQGNGPVEDVTIADVQCGGYSAGGIVGSEPAALHAEAAAGSEVELYWTLWPDSHVGPTITYMAKCPDSGCNDYMPGTEYVSLFTVSCPSRQRHVLIQNSAVWFKVQEAGREGTSNTWGATPLMTAGGTVIYTIPSCLAPGYYLVRHEIIALHAAYSYPGAQFYPGCHQLKGKYLHTLN